MTIDKYRAYARSNYTPGDPIDEMWHPDIQAEAQRMNDEEAARKEAERTRIREVVSGVADVGAELSGRIVVRVRFTGSLPKTKRLTKAELRLVMQLPEGVKAPVAGSKELFSSDEYDALESFISKRREEFASYGIPHIQFNASSVVDITMIPVIEALAEKTEKELAALVDALVAVYPSQVTAEASRLGPLYNPNDYVSVNELRSRFRFGYTWMAFGVPEELKQFDIRIYEKALAKSQETWREIEANGVLLLRENISELVGNLVTSLTPKEGGEKRKFFASTVENIAQFIETFGRRNICKDVMLDEEVEKLRKAVSGLDLKAMSTDVGLREKVKAQMEKARGSLDALVVSASARVIRYEEAA